jgi:hypothetical protein
LARELLLISEFQIAQAHATKPLLLFKDPFAASRAERLVYMIGAARAGVCIEAKDE